MIICRAQKNQFYIVYYLLQKYYLQGTNDTIASKGTNYVIIGWLGLIGHEFMLFPYGFQKNRSKKNFVSLKTVKKESDEFLLEKRNTEVRRKIIGILHFSGFCHSKQGSIFTLLEVECALMII